MRKWLSVALMVCLLMLAVSPVVAENKVLQDAAAPAIVNIDDGQGGTAAALIRDAQGNVIAAIPAADAIRAVDVNERAKEENADVAALLEDALNALMKDEHYASATALDTDLFYLEIPAEYADGQNQIEMAFAPLYLEPGKSLIVLSSTDGKTWQEETDAVVNADGTVKVVVNGSGLVTFLADGAIATEKTVEVVVDQFEKEVNVNFTPSITGKLAPEVVTDKVEGQEIVGYIVNDNGEDAIGIPAGGWMVTTALSESEYTPDVVAYEHLQWAYNNIDQADCVGSLANAGAEGTLEAAINAALEGTGLTCDDMTVSDMFRISLFGEYLTKLTENESASLEATFDKNAKAGDTVKALYADGLNGWNLIDDEDVVVNADGTVKLSIKNPGVVVFLVERAPAQIDANAVGTVTAP